MAFGKKKRRGARSSGATSSRRSALMNPGTMPRRPHHLPGASIVFNYFSTESAGGCSQFTGRKRRPIILCQRNSSQFLSRTSGAFYRSARPKILANVGKTIDGNSVPATRILVNGFDLLRIGDFPCIENTGNMMSLQLRLLSVLVLVAGNSREWGVRPTPPIKMFCRGFEKKGKSGKKDDATRLEFGAHE